MKSIVTSVSPYLCEKIASGDCRMLVKKFAPKEVPFKAYIYATKPKKFCKCGAMSTSNELLWLANGKVEMGDGFKFWADGDEYQCLNGRIIGEFVCDKIDDFYCASVPYQRENNLGYGQFIDNGVYKVNGWHEGIVFERNDRYIDTMLNNNNLKEITNKGLRLKLSRNSVYETEISSLGKTLFLTEAEAIAKLEELKQ